MGYRKFVYLPAKLCEKASEEGWMLSLTYFIRLKSIYCNSIYYHCSLGQIARMIGCSPTTLHFHLKILIAKGLVIQRDGHYCCAGFKRMINLFGKSFGIKIFVSPKKQLTFLRAAMLNVHLDRQKYKLKSIGIYCSKGQFVPNVNERWGRNTYVGLSAFGIGKKIDRSKSTGSRLRTFLVENKYWNMDRRYAVIGHGTCVDYRYLLCNNLIKPWTKHNPLTNTIYVERFPALSYNEGFESK